MKKVSIHKLIPYKCYRLYWWPADLNTYIDMVFLHYTEYKCMRIFVIKDNDTSGTYKLSDVIDWDMDDRNKLDELPNNESIIKLAKMIDL